MKLFKFLHLIRVHQWVKNVFVFVPLLFSQHLFDGFFFLEALFAFLIFCPFGCLPKFRHTSDQLLLFFTNCFVSILSSECSSRICYIRNNYLKSFLLRLNLACRTRTAPQCPKHRVQTFTPHASIILLHPKCSALNQAPPYLDNKKTS